MNSEPPIGSHMDTPRSAVSSRLMCPDILTKWISSHIRSSVTKVQEASSEFFLRKVISGLCTRTGLLTGINLHLMIRFTSMNWLRFLIATTLPKAFLWCLLWKFLGLCQCLSPSTTQRKAGGYQGKRWCGFHTKCHSMSLLEKKLIMLPRGAMNWIQVQLHRSFFM